MQLPCCIYLLYAPQSKMTGTNKSNWKEPLLLQEGLGDSSYCELYFLVKNLSLGEKTIPNDKEESDDNSHKLPSDLVQKICQYFFVPPVVHRQVSVHHVSSTSGQHPPEEVLNDSESTWWMSGENSMPRGRGAEFIEFNISGNGTVRRLSTVSLKIPPLPAGPLSVRSFRIEVATGFTPTTGAKEGPSQDDLKWTKLDQEFEVKNRTGFQDFVLNKAVDASRVRVVCLENQVQTLVRRNNYEPADLQGFECVGYYSIRFS